MCGEPLPEGARFCLNCGAVVATPLAAENSTGGSTNDLLYSPEEMNDLYLRLAGSEVRSGLVPAT